MLGARFRRLDARHRPTEGAASEPKFGFVGSTKVDLAAAAATDGGTGIPSSRHSRCTYLWFSVQPSPRRLP